MSRGPVGSRPGPHVAVVVLHWGPEAQTVRCLESLSRDSFSGRRTVFLIDNALSLERSIAGRFPSLRIELERPPQNLGFAEGCARGIARAMACGADFVLLLNNDAVVEARVSISWSRPQRTRPRRTALSPYRDDEQPAAAVVRGRVLLAVVGRARSGEEEIGDRGDRRAPRGRLRHGLCHAHQAGGDPRASALSIPASSRTARISISRSGPGTPASRCSWCPGHGCTMRPPTATDSRGASTTAPETCSTSSGGAGPGTTGWGSCRTSSCAGSASSPHWRACAAGPTSSVPSRAASSTSRGDGSGSGRPGARGSNGAIAVGASRDAPCGFARPVAVAVRLPHAAQVSGAPGDQGQVPGHVPRDRLDADEPAVHHRRVLRDLPAHLPGGDPGLSSDSSCSGS